VYSSIGQEWSATPGNHIASTVLQRSAIDSSVTESCGSWENANVSFVRQADLWRRRLLKIFSGAGVGHVGMPARRYTKTCTTKCKGPRDAGPLIVVKSGSSYSSMLSATKRGSPPRRTSRRSDLRPASRACAMRVSSSPIEATFCWPASVITSPARRPFS